MCGLHRKSLYSKLMKFKWDIVSYIIPSILRQVRVYLMGDMSKLDGMQKAAL